MSEVSSSITVLFEDPFYILIYERVYKNKYEVCKIVFGAEPKDYEVLSFLLKNFNKLKFSPPTKQVSETKTKINPKRMQREIKKLVSVNVVGTKAQQALKLLQEQNKIERKTKSREQIDEEKQREFNLKQQKRKEKHKGH